MFFLDICLILIFDTQLEAREVELEDMVDQPGAGGEDVNAAQIRDTL